MIDLKQIKNKTIAKDNLYCFCVILIIFFLDRYTKIIILNDFSENRYYLNDYINLDLVWNTGIGFGLLSSNSDLIYNLITFLITGVVTFLFFLMIFSEKKEKIIFSIILGGALGNLYDRLFYNAVPDFIDLHYKEIHWFTFNVADILITIGIIIFLIDGIFQK